MKVIILLACFFLTGLAELNATTAPDDPPAAKIRDHLQSFSSAARPQKVYLHLDKAGYQAGETIWFKAYLLDGISHKLDPRANNLYVELYNSDGNAMEMRILLVEDGFAEGEIGLGSDIPDGNYVLRAYTDWMRNFDEDYYYSQYLYIGNPDYENVMPRTDVRRNRRFNRNLDRMRGEYEVNFLPEGGNLVATTSNRVAVRVVDILGRGQEAEGEVVDDRGNVITRFTTGFNGIGVFEITPQTGQTYQTRISVNGQRQRNYDIPGALAEGYVLRVNQDDERINVSVTATVKPGSPLYSEEVILIGHTRGMPYYASGYKITGGKLETSIDKKLFPTGIAHFTLFTGESVPVAERLAFVDHQDNMVFSWRLGTTKVEGQDFIEMEIRVTDSNENPVDGTFSLSAVTGEQHYAVHDNDILSYMLLSSDLDGVVQEPLKYLKPVTGGQESIDNMLLTYGWSRFDWDKVLAGDLPEINYSVVRGLSLAGRVIDPAKNEGLRNHPVELTVRSGHDDVYTTQTGRNGNFAFTGLEYKGRVQVELSSRRLPANYPPAIDLNIKGGRGYDYEPGLYTMSQRVTERGEDWERVRGVSSSPYGSSIDRQTSPQMYGVPNQTIYIDPDVSLERNLYDVLRNRASGLSFEGGQITMRGPTSLVLSNEPRFMLDGIFINRDDFLRIYPKDIERIEIFRGPSAAIFGVRGSTGVILAYSRRPGFRGFEDVMELVIMGYHAPREFYSDVLTMPMNLSRERHPVKTVYWDPGIMSGEDGMINLRFPLFEGLDNLKFSIEGAGLGGGLGFGQFIIDIEE